MGLNKTTKSIVTKETYNPQIVIRHAQTTEPTHYAINKMSIPGSFIESTKESLSSVSRQAEHTPINLSKKAVGFSSNASTKWESQPNILFKHPRNRNTVEMEPTYPSMV